MVNDVMQLQVHFSLTEVLGGIVTHTMFPDESTFACFSALKEESTCSLCGGLYCFILPQMISIRFMSQKFDARNRRIFGAMEMNQDISCICIHLTACLQLCICTFVYYFVC
uniref:Uncharacterized protein n=1 Tax=Opuntia streptacantha TaxID=393608 RepID=A0A7C9CCR7_OPUST